MRKALGSLLTCVCERSIACRFFFCYKSPPLKPIADVRQMFRVMKPAKTMMIKPKIKEEEVKKTIHFNINSIIVVLIRAHFSCNEMLLILLLDLLHVLMHVLFAVASIFSVCMCSCFYFFPLGINCVRRPCHWKLI